MPKRVFLAVIILVLYFPCLSWGQIINGQVLDMETHDPLGGVNIENIHSGISVVANDTGFFLIAASKDQLLEFKKNGYKTVRIRIPMGYAPTYYKIIMKAGPAEMPAMVADKYNYKSDSIRFHDIYKHELDFPRMSTLNVIEHPFSALSKRNREVWAFQDDYDKTQKEKYVDYTFNEKLVSKLTGLTGNNLRLYMRRYRPSYEELRGMSEYTFYNYVKRTGRRFMQSSDHPVNSQ